MIDLQGFFGSIFKKMKLLSNLLENEMAIIDHMRKLQNCNGF